MGGRNWGLKALVLPGWLLALAGTLVLCTPADAGQLAVTAVRFWSLEDHTRIAIETNETFTYRKDRLNDPPRIFFDLDAVRPQFMKKGTHIIPVGDPRVKQIRVAETQPGVTRIVIDLEAGEVEYNASQSSRPDQLLIEIRAKGQTPPVSPTYSRTGVKRVEPEKETTKEPELAKAEPVAAPPVEPAKPKRIVRTFVMPAAPRSRAPERTLLEAPRVSGNHKPRYAPYWAVPDLTKLRPPVTLAAVKSAPAPKAMAKAEAPRPVEPPRDIKPEPSERKAEETATAPSNSNVAKPATRNSNGDRSLTRALGLKVRRVVIDPGHGGTDQGTAGVTGLLEKDLVLDISKRLGALIEEQLGSEVVYTRTTDAFIPLEERTRIANAKKADLFISLHANSSPISSVTGVETYYLSLTTLKTSLDVAARENATSERSIHELRELVQKIALKDKVDESREFATRVQVALSQLSIQQGAKGSARRDRGVKKAPFIVLIGASMPSILAEIGFLSNSKEEQNLRKPEYRQKLAEALFKGLSSYADSLSHFQVAQAGTSRSE
ncbi:MAG: N-acetylmuramoyl-L-alanine amidase [Bryobacterales bacterium]|nr:N-acetylmuramoyl-L-alanine amidase [Bryobacterales bacterium]